MKPRLPVVATLLLFAVTSIARADLIRPVDTLDGSGDCVVVMPPGVPVTVYVIDQFSTGSLGSEWRIRNPNEVGLLSVSSPFPYIGDPFTGIKFTYPSCLTGEFLICELTFINLGLQGCRFLAVVPLSGEPAVEITACDSTTRPGATWDLLYSLPGSTCTYSCLIPLATKPSTWGAVKALYR